MLEKPLVILMMISLYFIPSIVAVKRQHQNRVAIVATNWFLGWTVLGWMAALIWAVTEVRT